MDIFIDYVKETNGTYFVSIPKKLAKYVGIKKGDRIKVMITKNITDE